MAAGIPQLSVWTDLQAAGGTLLGYLRSATSAETTIRENGDDRASFRVALSDGMAAQITEGRVIRAEYDDDEIEEWIVQRTTDAFPEDTLSVECSGARNWLAERVLTIDEATGSGVSTFTFTGTSSAILTEYTTSFPEWPSWITVGTIDPTDSVTLTVANQNGLQAVLALLEAANLARPVADDAAVMRFRRLSNTEWKIDFLTALASGAYLETGKNVAAYSATKDRTQQFTAIAPTGADNTMAAEALFRLRAATGPSGGQYAVTVEALDGRSTVVLGNDQWNGYYIVDSTGAAHEVLDTVVGTPATIYVPDSALPVAPGTARLARNSSGDPLLVFRAPGAPTTGKVAFLTDTSKTGKINWTFVPSFDQYDGGVLRGWAETITVNNGATFAEDTANFETGASARKFTYTGSNTNNQCTWVGGSGGQFDGAYRAGTWVLGVRAYSEGSATSQRSVTITVKANTVAQTLTGTNNVTWTGTASGWQTAQVTFAMTGTADTTLEVTVAGGLVLLTPGSGTNFVAIDRVWLFRQGVDDGDNTLVGSEMMDLVNAAQRQLRPNDGAAPVTHNVTAIDRYRDDPTGFPLDELAPYTTARLVIPERSLDTSVRIVEVRRDLFQPLRTTIQLGALRRRLTSQV